MWVFSILKFSFKRVPALLLVIALLVVQCVVSFGTTISFIATNSDVIHKNQIAISAWGSAATQLYALLLGPVIISVIIGSMSNRESFHKTETVLMTRRYLWYRSLLADTAVGLFVAIIISVSVSIGWLCGVLVSHVAVAPSVATVAIFNGANVLAVVSWALFVRGVYILIPSFALAFATTIMIAVVHIGIVIKFPQIANWDILLQISTAVGYPFASLPGRQFLVILVSLTTCEWWLIIVKERVWCAK